MQRLTGLLCAAVASLLLLPAGRMLVLLFHYEGRFSLHHLAAAYADPGRLLELATTSLVVGIGTVALSLLLAVPLAFLLCCTNLPGRRALAVLALMGACMPLYIHAAGWMSVADRGFWSNAMLSVIWIQGLAYTPLTILLCGAHFLHRDPDQEQAYLLETGWTGVFRQACLHHHRGGIALAGCVIALLSLADITVTDLFMIRTFSEEVFTQFQLGAGPERAVAIAFPVIAAILLLMIPFRRLVTDLDVRESIRRAVPPIPLGRSRKLTGLVVWMGVIVLAMAPGGFLLSKLKHPSNLLPAWQAAGDELARSSWLTPLAGMIIAALAWPLAWALVRGYARRWIAACLALLFAVPGPVTGYGLILLCNRSGWPGMVYDGPAIILLAYVLRVVPFAVCVLVPAFLCIPRELEESASLEGASGWNRLRLLDLPWSWRALIAAACVGAVLSLGEMGASFLVAPPGTGTLSVRFFTLIHYGLYPDVAGMCLWLIGMVGLLAGVLAWLARSWQRTIPMAKP